MIVKYSIFQIQVKECLKYKIDAILQCSHYQINFDDLKTESGVDLSLVKDYFDQLECNIIIESTLEVRTSITFHFKYKIV